jgi:primosomal protein N' (replication factor Y)
VAGRAGRRHKKGKVIVQTFSPQHPVILETQNYNFRGFYKRELDERRRFLYPPYFRMISITIKHKKYDVAEQAAQIMASKLSDKLGNRVIGPSLPGISRLRGLYLQQIIVKMEKNKKLIHNIKALILDIQHKIMMMDGKKSIRINIDVDP